jgi:hypothetical protein
VPQKIVNSRTPASQWGTEHQKLLSVTGQKPGTEYTLGNDGYEPIFLCEYVEALMCKTSSCMPPLFGHPDTTPPSKIG